jgi:hypothetical protein
MSLLATSCARVIESDQISFTKIEFDSKTEQLHLVGGVMDGFNVISVKSMTNRGNDLIIEMQIQLTRKSLLRKGLSGSFDLNVSVAGGVQRVLFGEERTVIWRRPPA